MSYSLKLLLTTLIICSSEDQLVLEAFYKQNPKPNKAARAEILKDVKGMNEKEIQVCRKVVTREAQTRPDNGSMIDCYTDMVPK